MASFARKTNSSKERSRGIEGDWIEDEGDGDGDGEGDGDGDGDGESDGGLIEPACFGMGIVGAVGTAHG